MLRRKGGLTFLERERKLDTLRILHEEVLKDEDLSNGIRFGRTDEHEYGLTAAQWLGEEIARLHARRFDKFSSVRIAFYEVIEGAINSKSAMLDLARLLVAKAANIRGEQKKEQEAVLPKNMELMLHFLLSRKNRTHIIGDLEEEFHDIMLPKYGARWARWWYRWQAVRTVSTNSLRLVVVFEFLKKLAGG